MKNIALALGLFLLWSCTSPQQRVTYNTLFSVEKATVAAYDSYLDLVIAGKVKTNDVPKVSQAFNTFQLTMQDALAVSQFNTNAIASGRVVAQATRVTTAIATAKGK